MTRHESRRNAFTLIFQLSINEMTLEDMLDATDRDEIQTDSFCLNLLSFTLDNLADIDNVIKPHLNKWTLNRLPKVSLAVLRVSCTQLMYMPDLPASVIINEAVELAKEFGADDEYAFVNGALRSIKDAVRPCEE